MWEIGHVAKVCRGKKFQVVATKTDKKTNYEQEESHDPDLGLFTIKVINSVHTDAIQVKTTSNGVPIDMELDTGASVSLIPERIWREKLNAV